jgi:hypothetical protein
MALSTLNSEAPVELRVERQPSRSPRRRSVWRSLAFKAVLFLLLVFALDRAVGLVLKHGLERYVGLYRDAAVLCVGHSRTVLGIDDRRLEHDLGIPVAKYALNGVNAGDRLAMIKHYFARHPHSVKFVVYDVSAFTFSDKGLSTNSYRLLYPFIDDPAIAEHVKAMTPTAHEWLWHRAMWSLRFDEVTLSLAMRGFTNVRGNLKMGTVDVDAVRKSVQAGQARTMAIEPENVAAFEETIRFVQSRGAILVLAYIPTLDVLSDADRAAHDRIVAMLQRYAQANAGVKFLNYNLDYEHRAELFFDPIHMNAAGQKVVTDRLVQDLRGLQ